MSKVIRLNDALLNNIKEFIEKDRALDETIYKHNHGTSSDFIYPNEIAFGDDLNDWLNYIVRLSIGYTENQIKKWDSLNN